MFLDCKPLEPEELAHPVLATRIAARLHELHCAEVDIPKVPQLFPVIRNFIQIARGLHFDDPVKQKKKDLLDLDEVARAVDELEETCLASGSPIVLSHNDLLSGAANVLGGQDRGRICCCGNVALPALTAIKCGNGLLTIAASLCISSPLGGGVGVDCVYHSQAWLLSVGLWWYC